MRFAIRTFRQQGATAALPADLCNAKTSEAVVDDAAPCPPLEALGSLSALAGAADNCVSQVGPLRAADA